MALHPSRNRYPVQIPSNARSGVGIRIRTHRRFHLNRYRFDLIQRLQFLRRQHAGCRQLRQPSAIVRRNKICIRILKAESHVRSTLIPIHRAERPAQRNGRPFPGWICQHLIGMFLVLDIAERNHRPSSIRR